MRRLRILFLLYALGASLAFAQHPSSKQPPAQAKPVYPYTHGYLASLNDDVQYACAFAGTATQQLTAAMANIPRTGGQLDSFCLSGPQTISANIWAGFSKRIIWWLGTSAYTVNANATIPSNVEICAGPGGSITAGATFTLTNNSSPCLGGGGGPTPQQLARTCKISLGDGMNTIPAGTYPVSLQCKNDTGATITMTVISCAADNAGASTCDVANNSATDFLTGPITLSTANTFTAGTQSATVTVAADEWVNATFVADGVSKIISLDITGTL